MRIIILLLLSICASAYGQLRNGTIVNGALPNMMAYAPNPVEFDGANDYMARGAALTGDADGKKGTISVWLSFNSDNTAQKIVYEDYGGGSDGGLLFNRFSNYKLIVGLYSAGFVTRLEMFTTVDFRIADGWKHVMASWDVGTGANHMYVNGTQSKNVTTASSDGTIKYNVTDHGVGGRYDGTLKMSGCMADLWVSREYVDLGLETNRSKFYSPGVRFVDLGSDGSKPTGTAPIVFFRGTAANYGVNSGSGGNCTITGALTDCGTAP